MSVDDEVNPVRWQRHLARRWRLVALVSTVAYVALYVAGIRVGVVFAAILAMFALGRTASGFGWADGWDARGAQAADQIRERVVLEAMADTPVDMIAVYAAAEAEHLIAGHDGDAQSCTPCASAAKVWIAQRWHDGHGSDVAA